MLITAKNITKKYGKDDIEIIALNNVSFEIEEGSLVIILGASGAGKSTLLHILGGMERPTEGKFVVNNIEVDQLDNKGLTLFRRNEIGFVFQFYNLINNLSAFENVALAASVVKDAADPHEILKAVGLEHRKQNFPSELSGGEQQRVAIARALVKNSSVILCDEPTGALDSKTGMEILKLLQNLSREHKKTVIIVTHNQALSIMADHLIRLSDGQIIEESHNPNPADASEVEW